VKPDSLSRKFVRMGAKLELPRIRSHGLRHAAATMMLASGAHPKTVSERLGHGADGVDDGHLRRQRARAREETAAKVTALADSS
jgi:integrase